MARIRDLLTYNSDRIDVIDSASHLSNSHLIDVSMFQTYKFDNKNGDSMVITPKELKGEIDDFLRNELDIYSDLFIAEIKFKLIEKVNKSLKDFEESLSKHIDDKINIITENIISLSTKRIINDEVNKRVEEKLQRIKELLNE